MKYRHPDFKYIRWRNEVNYRRFFTERGRLKLHALNCGLTELYSVRAFVYVIMMRERELIGVKTYTDDSHTPRDWRSFSSMSEARTYFDKQCKKLKEGYYDPPS